MTKEQREELNKKIYDTLYEKSRVDGVRVLYEDEWPIDELIGLFESEVEKAKKEGYKLSEDFHSVQKEITTTDTGDVKKDVKKIKGLVERRKILIKGINEMNGFIS